MSVPVVGGTDAGADTSGHEARYFRPLRAWERCSLYHPAPLVQLPRPGAGQSLPSFLSKPVATAQSSFTAFTDLSNIAFSSPFSEISTTFSTPLAPITVGTPTYRSLTPYWPVSHAAHGRTRRLSR